MSETPPSLANAPSALLGQVAIAPANKVSVYTGGLFILAILCVCYIAAEVLVPICVALILNIVFRPIIRFLHSRKVPRVIAATLVIMLLIGGGVGLGTVLSSPVSEWGQKLPDELPKLTERLQFLLKPVNTIQKTVNQAEIATGGKPANTLKVDVKGDGLSDRLFSNTRMLLAEIFETLLVLFFFLISGDMFQQRFIEILPRVQDKKKALQISHQIESDISAYLQTITLMNLGVGLLTGLIMWGCQVEDPILWGSVAFLFNFVPILGPIAALGIFLLVGMITGSTLGMALLPAALYFVVHIIEGEVATPLILSKRFTLNPSLVILMLILWFWLWGVAGAFLAMPMLAILKIICDRTVRLRALGHLIEG